MAASFGRRYIELALGLPVSDWSGLGNLAQADLGEDLRCSMAWTYTLAMRFVDSSNNLSLSAAERNCLTARVLELEGELNETNAKLSEVQAKLSNLSSKRKEIRAKTKRLEGKVTCLERELREAKDTAAASQQRVTLLEAEVEVLRADLQSAQERCASLEAEKAKIDTRTSNFDATKAEIHRLKEKKKCMLEEFKAKKEWATDRAMYRIRSLNPNMDTSFLLDKEEEFLTKLKAQLAKEEVTCTTLNGFDEEENGEEAKSASASQK
ncbi:uncharacterized protein LOC133792311 [Humulus lupulus]|uniref:uncharacterized protein LOC133792311 n=1 Tax=Humulus lupulus TaxID=3486 RepID=UPI002B40C5A2|nr:uncharacterized protein LOC133792311 [Humulus lupulus]